MEFKIDKNDMLDKLKTNISPMFEILRNEGISPQDYNIILFLLATYKNGVISLDTISSEQLKSNFTNWLQKEYSHYAQLLDVFEPTLHKLSDGGLRELIYTISKLDTKFLNENFPDVFDSVLYLISQSQGRYGGEFIQPIALTRIMCGLADLKPDAKVFNPFAGPASFGVFLDKTQLYFGQELNREIWAIGTLRLMAHGKLGYSKYVSEDSISQWPESSESFDLIISNPPLGMRLGNQYNHIEPELRTIEQLLISKGVHSLKQDGKLIALLSTGFLFRGAPTEKTLRKFLIEEDLIDTIISLPGGLLQNTGVPIIILVLNKTKNLRGKVKFVDAENFVVSKGLTKKVLNDIALSNFLNSKKQDENVIQIVDNSQIQANDYNLNVPRYFKKRIALKNNERLVKLRNILEYVNGQSGSLPENGKFVRVRDLKDDIRDFQINVSEIEDVELRKSGVYQINETSLLLSMRWNSLKPTLFVYEGTSIYRNPDILSFKVNESIADYGYIINELQSDYVQDQLKSYRTGTTIPSISRDDLLEVEIKLPSLKEQKAKVQGIYEITDQINILKEEHNALAHNKAEDKFNEIASLKHTLGRPRQNILDWSDNLLDFLNNNKEGFEALNNSFEEFYEMDIISALKEIKSDINFITEVLEKGESGLILEEHEKKIIPLSDINNIINEMSNNGFKFKIKKLLLKGEKLKARGINGNLSLLKALLDNILTNANKHAFDEKNAGNEVVIELSEVDDKLSMEIKNNGNPFPKNYDKAKFITKYSTADSTNGSGLGGYDINRISAYFNNPDWVLSLNEDPIFKVIYIFLFPIKLID